MPQRGRHPAHPCQGGFAPTTVPVMLPNSRLLRRSSRAEGMASSPIPPKSPSKVLTKSPPSSPIKETHEPRQTMPSPHPIPSSNPASQYTLMEKLGTGSFGTVYKAMHNETKQIVAIKQIGTRVSPLMISGWALISGYPLRRFRGFRRRYLRNTAGDRQPCAVRLGVCDALLWLVRRGVQAVDRHGISRRRLVSRPAQARRIL